MLQRTWHCGVALAIACSLPARATDRVADSLADLSLEQLREVVVSTVSRLDERMDRVAAAAYVISAEDIRRSGATSIPQALRLAPMLAVAQADANQYAISARGLNNVLANKMLVLIDGRAVYSPLFSGVFWEAQDVLLKDVHRIEVITGPSTAMWGSNAVNGLIHVITRSATETQGPLAFARAGSDESGVALRYGAKVGDDARFRVYARSYDHDTTRRADRSPVNDAADGLQAGLRVDWSQARDTFTLQADAYRATIEQPVAAREISGANVTGRWQRVDADGASSEVQLYVDHTERFQPQTITEVLNTVDLTAQHSFRPAERHRVVLGGGHRHARDQVATGATIGFVPASRTLAWSRLFAQDQIDLAPSLALTVAASIERNPYTGAEFLPSVRLAWRASEEHLWWGSLSRAVRAPSRIDRELVQPAQPPYLFTGNPDFRSEVANVVELGYRAQPDPSLSYAVTLFHHEYRHLRSVQPAAQGLQFGNGFEGSIRGAEVWARWRANEQWRLDAGLVLQRQNLHVRAGAVDVGGTALLGNDAKHQAQLRSSLDLGAAWSWDIMLRHVGALPNPAVPSYTALDSRIAWKWAPSGELALVMRNLGDPRHAEWGSALTRPEFERSVSLQLRWQP